MYLANWKKAKERIREWESKGGLERVIEEKEKATSQMGQKDKESLENLYLIQAKLRKITGTLIQKLKDTSQDSAIKMTETFIGEGKYSWEEVENALRWIDWKKGKDVKFRVKYLDSEEKVIFTPGTKEESSYGWGTWQTNPFRFFFDSKEEYNKSMERVIEKENMLKRFLAGESIFSIVKNNIGSSESEMRSKYEKIFQASVDEAILDFEMQVASKLIEWIKPTQQQES